MVANDWSESTTIERFGTIIVFGSLMFTSRSAIIQSTYVRPRVLQAILELTAKQKRNELLQSFPSN